MTLEFLDIVRHYTADAGGGSSVVRAVDGVSLTVPSGELVALYGPSGSGKTTLLMLATGLLTPTRGTVRLDGRDISTMDDNEAADYRRRHLGVLLQNARLLPGMPAVENAATKLLGDGVRLADALPQSERWLRRLGLDSRRAARPHQLSLGERKRVALARALSSDPALVLADEPTANLDSALGRQVLELLREVATEQRAGVLLVTHDPRAVDLADHVHVMRDGRLSDDLDAELRWLAEARASSSPSAR